MKDTAKIGYVPLFRMGGGIIVPRGKLLDTHNEALEKAKTKGGKFPTNFISVGKVRYRGDSEE